MVPGALWLTLTYTTSNLNKLRNWLESNQYIYGERLNHSNRHPRNKLPQTCRWSKSVCPGLIRPTENLKSHLGTIFSINERWSNKYDTHKLTINEISLWYFISSKATSWSKKIWAPNLNPCQNLTKKCEGSKSVCPVWIRPTANLQSYPRTFFRINEHWSNQCEHTSQH